MSIKKSFDINDHKLGQKQHSIRTRKISWSTGRRNRGLTQKIEQSNAMYITLL